MKAFFAALLIAITTLTILAKPAHAGGTRDLIVTAVTLAEMCGSSEALVTVKDGSSQCVTFSFASRSAQSVITTGLVKSLQELAVSWPEKKFGYKLTVNIGTAEVEKIDLITIE